MLQRQVTGAFNRGAQQRRFAVSHLAHQQPDFFYRIERAVAVRQIETNAALRAEDRQMHLRLFIQRRDQARLR